MTVRGIGRFIVPGAFWFFVALVVLAPLPYGSAHLWSYSLLSIVTAVALILWVLATLFDDSCYGVPVRKLAYPGLLLAVVMLWIFVQGSTATPVAWHHPLWTEARTALSDPSIPGAISINPDGAPALLARMGTYAMVFWLAVQFGRSSHRAGLIFWAIAVTGMLYAIYGMWAHLSGSGKILFADKWAYHQSLTSTFVNRNHYAVFAGIGLIVSFAMAIRYLKRDASGAFDSSRRFLSSVENLTLPVFALIVVCVAIGSALLLTQSRGGVAFTAAGLLVLIFLLQTGGTLRKRSSLALIGGVFVLGIATFVVSGGDLTNRVSRSLLSSDRGMIHELALDAIVDAPLAGHGAGSFPALFHMFREADFPPIGPAFASAHSVYLEFAAEVGIPAAILYFGAILFVIVRCFIGARERRRNQIYPAAGGAVGVLVILHSYLDFGPQIPGMATTFAALLGVAFAQSWATRGRRSDQSGDR